MSERYFAYKVEVLSQPGSELWNENQQGGFGWFLVRATSQSRSLELLKTEFLELGYSLREIIETFEIMSESDFEDKELLDLLSLLKTESWQVQYRTLDTYPFNAIE